MEPTKVEADHRWALVLGTHDSASDEFQLSAEEQKLEDLLKALYGSGGEKGSLSKKPQKIRKWLEGIRNNFEPEVIRLMQQDALERQNAHHMLLEPELLDQIEADVKMVATILALRELLPDRAMVSAKSLVQKLVKQTEKKIKPKLTHAVRSSQLGRSRKIHPSQGQIDWHKTIGKNLRHYMPDIQAIIPDVWYGRKHGARLTEIVLLVDKSESMIQSAIYASIIGSVLASLNTIKTHLVFFDTSITDMTDQYSDPVEILFSVPMGGGTDIKLGLDYIRQKIRNPHRTILFLISDLDEGGPVKEMLESAASLVKMGCSMHCIVTLDDDGKSVFNESNGQKLADLGIPVFASSPDLFPDVLADVLNKHTGSI
ncbi:MAG: VWA domain-containing protein [Saprospiraceae bacterium]|nr:VWA domain-containing protein [Saprospiraceae bacterium]MBK7810279.1 VWA domain-containing protein [Saprospiraceae bacterium]MBK9629882.1 VWA domain-containing protein [Saprospiraceae bacterium]